MKMHTESHRKLKISAMSEDIADEYISLVTPEQWFILKENVYTLESKGEMNLYHGCGRGWAEFDKAGMLINLRYADSLEDEGTTLQNVDCREFSVGDLAPLILANGNMRVLVNFSSYELCRF